MKNERLWKKRAGIVMTIAAIGVLALLLGSCGAGPISYDEADELANRVQDLRERVELVESELADLRSEQEEELTTTASEKVDFAQSELSQVAVRLNEIEETLKQPEPPAGTGQPGQPAPGQPGQPQGGGTTGGY